jgi:hypothetical protein
MSRVSPGNPYGRNTDNIVPLDAQKHAGLGVDQSCLRRFIAQCNVFAITLPEFFHAARHYPVVFVKAEDATMRASVITGLRQNQNLYVDTHGDWQEQVYVPASVRQFPFYAVAAGAVSSTDKTLVMVDESALVSSDEPFFDRHGEATAKWKASEIFTADFSAADKQTSKFAARMAELGLLEAFDAQVNPQQRGSLKVTGMYRINEDRLNRLAAKTVRELMEKGEMSRIYAHLISLENFAKLLDLSAAAELAPF